MHDTDPQSMESWLHDTAEDDQRRFDMLRQVLPNKKLLDFGCGNGGFLHRAKFLANVFSGVEPERRVREYWEDKISIHANLEEVSEKYDLITAFHVIEHLLDPRLTIQRLQDCLNPQGRIVIEVPSSTDALLTLYDCEAFQNFTYWSQHLFLFNNNTLETLAKQAGMRVVALQQYQRYPLSNHLYWLSRRKPGGHQQWAFLDDPLLKETYAKVLASIGSCDTLIAWLEKS